MIMGELGADSNLFKALGMNIARPIVRRVFAVISPLRNLLCCLLSSPSAHGLLCPLVDLILSFLSVQYYRFWRCLRLRGLRSIWCAHGAREDGGDCEDEGLAGSLSSMRQGSASADK